MGFREANSAELEIGKERKLWSELPIYRIFIYLFTKYLLRTYYVPVTPLENGNMVLSKTSMMPAFKEAGGSDRH